MEEIIESVQDVSVEETKKYPEEVEKASESFTNNLKLFKNLVLNTHSRKGLARVLNAAAEFPLGKQYPRLLNQQERNLFILFQELVNDKSVVLTHFLHNNIKKGEENVKSEDVAEDRHSTKE